MPESPSASAANDQPQLASSPSRLSLTPKRSPTRDATSAAPRTPPAALSRKPFPTKSPRRDVSTSCRAAAVAWVALDRCTLLRAKCARLADRMVLVLDAVTNILQKSAEVDSPTDTKAYQFEGKAGSENVFMLQTTMIDIQAFALDFSSTKDRLALLVHNIPKTLTAIDSLTKALASNIAFYAALVSTELWEVEDTQDTEKDLGALPRLFRLSLAMRGSVFDEFLCEKSPTDEPGSPGKRREEFIEWCFLKNPSLRPAEGEEAVRTWTAPPSPSSPISPPLTPSSKSIASRQPSKGTIVRLSSGSDVFAAKELLRPVQRSSSGIAPVLLIDKTGLDLPSETLVASPVDASVIEPGSSSPSSGDDRDEDTSATSVISLSVANLAGASPVKEELEIPEPLPTCPAPTTDSDNKLENTQLSLPLEGDEVSETEVTKELIPPSLSSVKSSDEDSEAIITSPRVEVPEIVDETESTKDDTTKRKSLFAPQLVLRAATPISRQASPEHPYPGLRILSFDGGGIRGLTLLLTLRAVLSNIAPRGECPRPFDAFDYITGIGTGGLVALLLGRLRLTCDDAIDVYLGIAHQAFINKTHLPRSRWSKLFGNTPSESEGRDAALDKVLTTFLPDRYILDDDVIEDPDLCKTSVLSYPDSARREGKPRWIRTHDNSDPHAFSAKEAIRATMASSPFFKPWSYAGTYAFGGSPASQNPSEKALDEITRTFGSDRKIECFVSIGVGSPSERATTGKGSKTRVRNLKVVEQLVSESRNIAERVRTRANKEGWAAKYMRYDLEFPASVDPGIEEWKNLNELDRVTQRMIKKLHSVDMASSLKQGLFGNQFLTPDSANDYVSPVQHRLRNSISLEDPSQIYLHETKSTGSLA